MHRLYTYVYVEFKTRKLQTVSNNDSMQLLSFTVLVVNTYKEFAGLLLAINCFNGQYRTR